MVAWRGQLIVHLKPNNVSLQPPAEGYVFECVHFSVFLFVFSITPKSNEWLFLIFFMHVGSDQRKK